ncbi:LysR family transcriptional regulator protein [Rhizobium gallicum]|uniref:LysR family transcriptional regulator protein n=1 Tax=Rhizobium gallicum TaxID=56730 RepID=A0A1L5NDR4_9HYPH|nr:LysR family transcriptional regulator protein [Rhizobium gallicum]
MSGRVSASRAAPCASRPRCRLRSSCWPSICRTWRSDIRSLKSFCMSPIASSISYKRASTSQYAAISCRLPIQASCSANWQSMNFFWSPRHPYVDRHGAPQRPEDLVAHAAVMPSLTETAWRLFSATGDETLVKPPPVMAADEPFVLLRAAAAGMGITILPTSVCREAIEQGRLIRILPEWTAGNITTTVLLPHRRGQLPSVRAVVEFIGERLGQP